MNRQILFRAKSLDHSRWLKGLPQYTGVNSPKIEYVFPHDGFDSPDCYEIDPYTLGQFTGLLDKDKTQIFEGDILSVSPGNPLVADHVRLVRFVDGQFIGQSHLGINYSLRLCAYKGRIIGNIHDNPELL